MATVKTNIWDLKVGDEIHFTNSYGTEIKRLICRLTESSCYLSNRYGNQIHSSSSEDLIGNRNSYNTIASYLSYPDAKIIRN